MLFHAFLLVLRCSHNTLMNSHARTVPLSLSHTLTHTLTECHAHTHAHSRRRRRRNTHSQCHSHLHTLTHSLTHPHPHTLTIARTHARTQPSPPPLPPTESIAEEWNAAFADTNKRSRDDVFKTGRGYNSSTFRHVTHFL